MPRIDRIFTLEVTPEQFLQSCSFDELQEINLLLDGYMERAERAKRQSDEASDWSEVMATMNGKKIEGLKPMYYKTGFPSDDTIKIGDAIMSAQLENLKKS